ncbi:MAG: polyhydroxyalkanoic acid system family protein [Acidobacteriota bacterium]
MPELDISIPHQLRQDEAAERIKGLLGQMKKDYGESIQDLNEEWSGNSCRFGFSVMGSEISGTLDILNDEVRIKGGLPFTAGLFKGKIEKTIREKAAELLS